MSLIKRLSESSINRIAAGEVVDRPSSVVKELVENAIDAGSTEIDIIIEQAGKNLISIKDNGQGMSKADLNLAVERHTTSKLNENNIMDIHSFGFRGEALPSIASVSRIKLTSRQADDEIGHSIIIEGGEVKAVENSSCGVGTLIEVRDLFFATPARLKFLKADRTEASSCIDIIRRIAIAHPHIGFSLINDGRRVFALKVLDNAKQLDALKARVTACLNKDFISSSVPVDCIRDDINIKGLIGLSTAHKATSDYQLLYVNNRPVKDKLLSIAVRVAYKDILPAGRHPMLVLFIDMLPEFVDVNVHPAKSEVRFRDNNIIRSSVINVIRDAISLARTPIEMTQRSRAPIPTHSPASTPLHPNNIDISIKHDLKQGSYSKGGARQNTRNTVLPKSTIQQYTNIRTAPNIKLSDKDGISFKGKEVYTRPESITPPASLMTKKEDSNLANAVVLGVWNKKYILSLNEGKLRITSLYAASIHYINNKIKAEIKQGNVSGHRLTSPEIVDLKESLHAESIMNYKDVLKMVGISINKFGDSSIVVTEIPTVFFESNIAQIINELGKCLSSVKGAKLDTAECIDQVLLICIRYSNFKSAGFSKEEVSDLTNWIKNYSIDNNLNRHYPLNKEITIDKIDQYFATN